MCNEENEWESVNFMTEMRPTTQFLIDEFKAPKFTQVGTFYGDPEYDHRVQRRKKVSKEPPPLKVGDKIWVGDIDVCGTYPLIITYIARSGETSFTVECYGPSWEFHKSRIIVKDAITRIEREGKEFWNRNGK